MVVMESSCLTFEDNIYPPPAEKHHTNLLPKKRCELRRPRLNISSTCWMPSDARTLQVLGYSSILVVPLILTIWLPLNINGLLNCDIFEGRRLGGSLTLAQAKAVDFVCSAIFAPVLLCLFNYVWFANARASLVNMKRPRTDSVSLHALVEASGTKIGSYNIFKIWTLCRSSSRRLVLLAMLTILAAITQSSLSNIIAYEAFLWPLNSQPIQLRLLGGPRATLDQNDQMYLLNVARPSQGANSQQYRMWGQQVDTLELQLKWQNLTSALDKDEGAYIAPNVIKQDLDKLDSSITVLHDVPALRATIECTPHTEQTLLANIGRPQPGIDFGAFTNKPFEGWSAFISPGLSEVYQQATVFTGGMRRTWPFVASNVNGSSLYVGAISGSFQGLNDTKAWIDEVTRPVTSPLGTVQAGALNLTSHLDKPMSCEMARWTGCMIILFGLVCQTEQRSGLVNLVRDNASGSWTSTAPRWSTQTSPVKFLQPLPPIDYGDSVVSSATTFDIWDTDWANDAKHSGGPKDYDFQTLAYNTLYLNMELQRIGYEVGALNTSLATQDLFVSVESTREVQRYRVTYIPILLITGLLSLFLASMVMTSLMVSSSKSRSLGRRNFRMIDSLRLLTDSVASLSQEDFQYKAPNWSTEELESWAKQYMIRYEVSQDAEETSEPPSIALSPVTRSMDEDRP